MTSKATNKFSPEVRTPRGAAGSGSRTRAYVAVGGGFIDRRQDRLQESRA